MNRIQKIIPVGWLAISLVLACSTSDKDETAIVLIDPPSPATLIFPENNTECNEGEIISDTETDVLFQWQEANYTSSYILKITNLNDGTSRNISTPATEFLIRILRGTPYSWSVKSIAGGTTETAESELWKFYNSGLPKESHPPFPAEAISPQNGSSVDEGNLSLRWAASDVDNDITSFKIFLDTSSPPNTEVGTTGNNSIDITVSAGLIYYWKVITTDEVGNLSHSPIFQFMVN